MDEARARIAAALQPLAGEETVALAQALGRVLAHPILSPLDVPGHDNSAMDGYALRSADLQCDRPTALCWLGATSLAGQPWHGRLAAGECVRIMTGAVMPAGLDTVVPQELCKLTPSAEGAATIEIPAGAIEPGAHCRRRGEDLARGAFALPAGRRLQPADLGLIASLGLPEVVVRARPRVALFSSGDELHQPGQPLAEGGLYDSNRYSLMGALQRLGVEVLDLGMVADDPAALNAAIDRAVAWSAHAVLSSGGVSVGDADHTRNLLTGRGEIGFWQVAMRPGRPFAFGRLRGKAGQLDGPWLFALPGNPVAALVSFYVLVRDAMLQLAGATPAALPRLRVAAAEPLRKRAGRSEYQRGVVSLASDGHWQVRLTGPQGSAWLGSLTQANALVVLDAAQGNVNAGDEVEVWLLEGLM